MSDILAQLPGLLTGAGVGGVLAAYIYTRGKNHETDRTVDAQLEEHRDGLALDLLCTAREERAAMREEIDRMKNAMRHLDDFDLAIAHVEALLSADTVGNREAVERSARQFLDRIGKQRAEAGAFRGEAQHAVSETRMAGAVRETIAKWGEDILE